MNDIKRMAMHCFVEARLNGDEFKYVIFDFNSNPHECVSDISHLSFDPGHLPVTGMVKVRVFGDSGDKFMVSTPDGIEGRVIMAEKDQLFDRPTTFCKILLALMIWMFYISRILTILILLLCIFILFIAIQTKNLGFISVMSTLCLGLLFISVRDVIQVYRKIHDAEKPKGLRRRKTGT